MSNGAIGVFDSGVGGVSVHKALVEALPRANFLYLADHKHAPYGERSGDEIVELTKAGAKALFDRGASLVVLACNTASAVALRRLQQSWIPGLRRELGRPVNLLGIIVPTIEAATGLPWEVEPDRSGDKIEKLDVIGVFCTTATSRSRVYEIEIDKRREDLAVFSEPCSGLVDMIEAGGDSADMLALIKTHAEALRIRIGRAPDRAILGCTHYELVADLFKAALPPGTPLIHQPSSVASALSAYVARHPDYAVGTKGLRSFFTTGDWSGSARLTEAFWGSSIQFEQI